MKDYKIQKIITVTTKHKHLVFNYFTLLCHNLLSAHKMWGEQ